MGDGLIGVTEDKAILQVCMNEYKISRYIISTTKTPVTFLLKVS